MAQILCSTGALIGRPNGRDYRLLKELVPQLECDGIEFMMYGSWYGEAETLMQTVKSYGFNVPVVHCEKALGESLAGMKVWYEDGQYPEKILSEDEDRELFAEGLKHFDINLKLANTLGADRMVLHLWNGLVSDKNLSRNIERFGLLKEKAEKAGIDLMVENVICNTFDPLSNIISVHDTYPDVHYVYDTKMAEFHGQLMDVFRPENEWIFAGKHVRHLHINDYDGGYMDWGNLKVLPIGKGHVDFKGFFEQLSKYGYSGDFTVEATGFDHTGKIDVAMLNNCFDNLRKLTEQL